MARTSVRSTANVDFSGPFFQKDVTKTIFQNIERMMQGLAEEGATAARAGLRTGSGGRALVRELGDRVADHVIGRTTSRVGNRWVSAAVVQVYNEGLSAAESRSLMAAASYVEKRTRAISRVTRQLRSSREALRANLTAGIE